MPGTRSTVTNPSTQGSPRAQGLIYPVILSHPGTPGTICSISPVTIGNSAITENVTVFGVSRTSSYQSVSRRSVPSNVYVLAIPQITSPQLMGEKIGGSELHPPLKLSIDSSTRHTSPSGIPPGGHSRIHPSNSGFTGL